MKKALPFLVVALVIVYAIYNAKFRNHKRVKTKVNTNDTEYIHEQKKIHYKEELLSIQTIVYTKQYIVDVINYGSKDLKFKKNEIMQEGFASKENAPKIACYVLELAGKKCKESYPEDAALFYTSNCGGCHGDDGKGIGGTYPDLTKAKMLGIEKREDFLQTMIRKMQ